MAGEVLGKWDQAVSRYGIEFLVRIHLRKREFEKLHNLIKKRKIEHENHLRFIRNEVYRLEDQLSWDFRLERYRDQMADLRRLAQMRLNSKRSRKKKKN